MTQTERKRRSDGERSRATILQAAGQLATIEGLEGLTIGRLADHIGMSKSGLYAHFGSKEELQLETIAAAERLFEEDIVIPAQAAEPGIPRLEALSERFISHVQRGVFPGGCFFSSVMAEFDTRPGRVRDRVAAYLGEWQGHFHAEVVNAQNDGQIASDVDGAQIVFEIEAALLMANTLWVLKRDEAVFDRARAAIAACIAGARA